LNYDENQIQEFQDSQAWRAKYPFSGENSVAICGKLETDIFDLPVEDRQEFASLYEGLNFSSGAIIPSALNAADQITYFTFGHLGLKQWSVPKGTTAIGAAKRLHTDFANRFVAAEVFTVDLLLSYESVDQLKSHGKIRLEGRDYVVQDGDILYFRFSK